MPPGSDGTGTHRIGGTGRPMSGVPVLDLLFVLGILALFTLVGAVAAGVEKL